MTNSLIQVEVYRIGLIVRYRDNLYAILTSETLQTHSGRAHEPHVFPEVLISTTYDLLPVTDEGEDSGKPVLTGVPHNEVEEV